MGAAIAYAVVALASLAGGFIGDKGVSGRTVRHRGRYALGKIQRSDEAFGRLQQRELETALSAITGGYDTAKQEIGRGQRAAKQTALDRQQQSQARLKQQLARSGLGGSTISSQLESGLEARTQRELSNIDASFARDYSNLAVGRGAAEAQGRTALSNFFGQRGAQERAVHAQEFSLLTGQQFGGQGSGTPLTGATSFGGGGGVDLSGLGYALAGLGGGLGGGDSRTAGGAGLNSLGNTAVPYGPVA